MCGLGRFATQKFPAGGQIEKQRARFDTRARGVATVADFFDPAALDEDFRAHQRAGLAGSQSETRHAGDARQGFATKSQRGNGREVRAGAEFAGGVTFQAQQRVVAVHAVTVVGHPHQRDAAALDDHFHRGRPRVEAVFHQFFDDRRRPLDHLPRRHLTGDDFGQQGNSAHGKRERKDAAVWF